MKSWCHLHAQHVLKIKNEKMISGKNKKNSVKTHYG
jgi:hypothetical protein